ncbi:D-amino-acid transaminase [Dichotomicrobium thermohalophilum]|uniref:Probable branched-chain-amino-acid aminotransferase n=1 Tax=Dichotomicrobium thermohalophilum TaxID=933063 RepID=A0A397Q8Q6_9HYPH|nr:D-amino-acid transaminase [Dichotomicrobium thermohalophilum]RIA56205.1 D-alanine transaminase [Dichotomicrobium thermohalophilum]
MTRYVYVNGEFVEAENARISIFDRGFLFADGVYEVTAVLNGRMIDFAPHLQRLRSSLAKLDMTLEMDDAAIEDLHQGLITRNRVENGVVYIQVTRGVAERDFAYPSDAEPTVIAFTQPRDYFGDRNAETGVKVVTTPDLRWVRRDIKSIALLPQAMGKQEAKKRGAYEAWMVEDGLVTEGTSSSAFIVTQEGVIVTRALGREILPGLTRSRLLSLIEEEKLPVDQRPFSVEEAVAAREAFLTSASSFVLPVVSINDYPVGDGEPGPIARRLRARYLDFATPA